MTYRKFVRHIMKETGLLREDAQVALRIVFDAVKQVLLTGESIPIPELGTFYPKFSKSRPWISPSTGESIMLEGRVKLRFKPSRKFEKHMNQSIKERMDDENKD